jgi:hypothetical protein
MSAPDVSDTNRTDSVSISGTFLDAVSEEQTPVMRQYGSYEQSHMFSRHVVSQVKVQSRIRFYCIGPWVSTISNALHLYPTPSGLLNLQSKDI